MALHFWKLPVEHTSIAAFSWATFVVGCALLWAHHRDPQRPLNAAWRRLMLLMGWCSLLGRTLHESYLMLSPVEAKLVPMFKGGQVHAGVVMTSMFDVAVPLSVLPVWLRGAQLVQRACLFMAIMHRYIPAAATMWSQLCFVLCHGVLPWVAVLLPFVYIHIRDASARAAKQMSRSKQVPDSWVVVNGSAGATASSRPCSSKQQHAAAHGAADAGQQQQQASGAGCTSRSSAVRCAHVPAAPAGALHGAAQQAASTLALIRQTPYRRKLGTIYKASLKLQTDLPCASLPTDLALVLQHALHGSGSHMHMLDLAVRPGCITLAFSLLDCGGPHLPGAGATPSGLASGGGGGGGDDRPGGDGAPGVGHLAAGIPGADSQTSSRSAPALQSAAHVARSLMPQLQQLLPDLAHGPRGAACEGSPPKHLLQVEDHVFTLVWSAATSSWLLEPRAPAAAAAERGAPPAHTPAAEPPASDSSQPWLGMALVQQQQLQQPAWPAPRAAAAASQAARSVQPGAAHSPGVVQLLVQVQAWGLSKLDEVVGWEPPALDGRAGPPGRAVHAGPHSPALQLLAKGGLFGGYLVTHVVRVFRTPGMPQLSTVQVLVDVPPQLLVRHHAGGPASSLQLLTLELWQAERCISRCPLLAAHTPPSPSSGPASAAAPGTGPSGAAATPSSSASSSAPSSPGSDEAAEEDSLESWWWGAKDLTVAAAVSELGGTGDCLAAEAGHAEDALPPYLAFLQDLSLWLMEARVTSMSSRTCWSGGPAWDAHAHQDPMSPGAKKQQQRAAAPALPLPAWLQQPCLPLLQQQLLAEGLLEFAAAVGLVHVHRMVGEQLRMARAVLPVPPGEVHGGVQGPHGAWRWRRMACPLPASWLARIHEALVGFPCHLCEQQYQAQLVRTRQGSLAAMQALVVLLGVALSVRSWQARDWVHVAMSVPWALLNARELLLKGLRMRGTRSLLTGGLFRTRTILAALQQLPASRRPGRAPSMWGPVLPWLWRVGCRWSYTLGVLQRPAILTASPYYLLVAWPLLQLTLALTEQVQASTVLPAHWVLLLACCLDMPASLGYYWTTLQPRSSFCLMLLTMPLIVVAPRLVLDAHMRRRFRAGTSGAAASRTQGAHQAKGGPQHPHQE